MPRDKDFFNEEKMEKTPTTSGQMVEFILSYLGAEGRTAAAAGCVRTMTFDVAAAKTAGMTLIL